MKSVRVALISLALLATPLAAKAPDAATLARIDQLFAEWQVAAHVPGLAYGIVADGHLVVVRGLGVQNLDNRRAVGGDSLFRIASMSKSFTALAILKLRDEGKLSLDAPAERYLPQLASWRYPTSDSPRITVRNLLTHSAGFVEDNPWGDRQQVMNEDEFTAVLAAGVPFARAPGLQMEYSNLGYATLGRIIATVSGRSYQSYIRDELMRPLGMESTTFDIFASPPERRAIGYRWEANHWTREPDMKDGAFGAMGGVETSAHDYAKWVAFLLSAWPARDGPDAGPVRRSTVREIVTGSNFVVARMRNPAAGGAPCRQAITYAMGWGVSDDCDLGRMVAHSGGYPGYGSNVLLLPDQGVGIFAFASRTYQGPSLPILRAALVLKSAGVLADRTVPLDPGLAAAYDAARAVWREGRIPAAPTANNMLMDHDAAAWSALVAGVKAEVGTCAGDEPLVALSAMEGRFRWTCSHGRVTGRVQRAPTPTMTLQALEFAPDLP